MSTLERGKPKPIEARRALRARTFYGGRIVYRDGAYSVDCIVRDFSGDGACIELPAARLVAKRFYLLTLKQEIAYDAEVVWRHSELIGLKFIGTIDLARSKVKELGFLKRFWLELVPRP